MNTARTFARQHATQALYQWQVGGQSLTEIERQFREERDLERVDPDYFHELLSGIGAHTDQIDTTLGEFTDRTVAQVDPVERAILRIGGYELLFCPDIPCKVVINESVNLAKRFGAMDSHKYVNGILDKVARRARAAELAHSG